MISKIIINENTHIVMMFLLTRVSENVVFVENLSIFAFIMWTIIQGEETPRGGSRILLGGGADPPGGGASIHICQVFPKTT